MHAGSATAHDEVMSTAEGPDFLSDEEMGMARREKSRLAPERVDEINASRDVQLEHLDAELEGLIGGSVDFLPFSFLEEGVSCGNAVARIEVRKKSPLGIEVLGHGTGFLVAPDLMMTNNHVLKEAAIAEHSRAQFRYEIDMSGAEKEIENWSFDPASFFVTSPKTELDFTIVRVKARDGAKPGDTHGFVPLRAGDHMKLNERINVIQHPKGRRKEVVLYENRITAFLEEEFVHYEADTLKGSSGAPVFNQQWDLVALHHSGVFRKDENGEYVIVDGEYTYEANEGVRLSKIIEHLRSDKLSEEHRAVIGEWIF